LPYAATSSGDHSRPTEQLYRCIDAFDAIRAGSSPSGVALVVPLLARRATAEIWVPAREPLLHVTQHTYVGDPEAERVANVRPAGNQVGICPDSAGVLIRV